MTPSLVLPFIHLYGTNYTRPSRKPTTYTFIRDKLLIQGQTVLAQAVNQRLWYYLLGESEGETNLGEISQECDKSQPI